ncbi:MAG: 2-amino-4-hydroxy-6-hydroxymethyldihydropteridine diphosphokinase [Hydrogenobacter sp.]|uniref:2-amino-4-hydroxy-6- hydroxymethyldihydropteridine diphosphokinase n=1 Tax=Hydrogenobacter thermophilus TaxID=940 RepID=UPI0030F76069
MSVCYVSFGSNWGDRIENILKALTLLADWGNLEAVSTLYESLPWGVEDQPTFLNGVLKFNTELDPLKLLKVIKDIERRVGRKERYRWGPREIDLDILLYDRCIVMLSFLRIPHQHMLERDFVLFPLLELDENLMHPILEQPIKLFAGKLKNNLKPYACITSYSLRIAPSFPG